jgi:hypothetical protein
VTQAASRGRPQSERPRRPPLASRSGRPGGTDMASGATGATNRLKGGVAQRALVKASRQAAAFHRPLAGAAGRRGQVPGPGRSGPGPAASPPPAPVSPDTRLSAGPGAAVTTNASAARSAARPRCQGYRASEPTRTARESRSTCSTRLAHPGIAERPTVPGTAVTALAPPPRKSHWMAASSWVAGGIRVASRGRCPGHAA